MSAVTTTTLAAPYRPTVHVMHTGRPTDRTVAQARRWLAAHLPAHGRTDDALLVLSELVTNAVLYADPPLQITAEFHGARLRLTVADRAPAAPHLRALPDDEHGLGLAIVKALCDGFDETTEGGRHEVTAALTIGGAS